MKPCEYHKVEIDAICDEFDSEINYGLTNDKIESARKRYGLNKLTPPPDQRKINCIKTFLCNRNMCCICVALILCIIGLVSINSISNTRLRKLSISVLLILTVFIFTTIIISATFFYWIYMKEYNENIMFNTADQVTVIRNQAKTQLIVEGYIHQELKVTNTIDDITELLIKYCAPETIINAEELVPGDIVKIKAGDKIHADIRVVECTSDFGVDQSSLTGECETFIKSPKISSETTVADAENLMFFGTNCVSGEGKGIVLYIGDDTFMGKIAALASYIEEYGDFYQDSINKCIFQWSCCLCCCSVLFFILLLALKDIIWHFIFVIVVCWVVVGIVIIIIGVIFVLIIWKSKYDFMNKLQIEYGMNIRSIMTATHLSNIGTLIIRANNIVIDMDDEICDGVNMSVRDAIEMGIKLIIISGAEINTDMLDDNSDNITILSNISCGKLFNIIQTQKTHNNGVICFVGGQLVNDVPLLKSADIGIAINEYSTDIGKEAADIICYETSNSYLHSIIQSVNTSKQFQQSIGYKVRKVRMPIGEWGYRNS